MRACLEQQPYEWYTKNFSQNGGIYFRCQTFFCLLVNYFTTSVVRLIYICVWTFLSKMFSARLTNFTIFFTTNHIMFLMCCVEIQSLRYYCCFRSSGSTISLSKQSTIIQHTIPTGSFNPIPKWIQQNKMFFPLLICC